MWFINDISINVTVQSVWMQLLSDIHNSYFIHRYPAPKYMSAYTRMGQ